MFTHLEVKRFMEEIFEGFISDKIPEVRIEEMSDVFSPSAVKVQVRYTRHGHTAYINFEIALTYSEQEMRRAVDINMTFLELKWDMEYFYKCLHPNMRRSLQNLQPRSDMVHRCTSDLQCRLVWLLDRASILSVTPVDGYKNLEYKVKAENSLMWSFLQRYAASENYH